MSGLRMTGLLALAAVTACGATSDKPAAATRASNEFNADSAMSYIRQQLAFGPRVPGTEPARRTGDWIVTHLHATADTVRRSAFSMSRTGIRDRWPIWSPIR